METREQGMLKNREKENAFGTAKANLAQPNVKQKVVKVKPQVLKGKLKEVKGTTAKAISDVSKSVPKPILMYPSPCQN